MIEGDDRLVSCIICKFGHNCPHTGKVDDLHHALMFISEDMPDENKFDDLCKRFEKKDKQAFRELNQIIKKQYGISMDFELGYSRNAYLPVDIQKCEKFEQI